MNKIKILAICISFVFVLTGCNKQIIDFDYTYNKAVCSYENNSFTLEIDSWKDYDGEQIQVITKDKTYLISMNNCYLIK